MNGTVIVTWARSGRTWRDRRADGPAERLDRREQVVPAARVEPGRVLAQLVQDLLHLERGVDRLDQHRRADGAARDPERGLGLHEHVVPEPRLAVGLELRAGRSTGRCHARPGTAPFQNRYSPASNRLAETGSPSTSTCRSTRCQPRGRTSSCATRAPEPVRLALGGVEREAAAHGGVDRRLAADHVRPRRRQRILEVRHERPGARVERVDDHLRLGRAGDLDPAVEQVRRRLGDAPASGQGGSRPSRAAGRAWRRRRSPPGARRAAPAARRGRD